jgi:hypothetical protein
MRFSRIGLVLFAAIALAVSNAQASTIQIVDRVMVLPVVRASVALPALRPLVTPPVMNTESHIRRPLSLNNISATTVTNMIFPNVTGFAAVPIQTLDSGGTNGHISITSNGSGSLTVTLTETGGVFAMKPTQHTGNPSIPFNIYAGTNSAGTGKALLTYGTPSAGFSNPTNLYFFGQINSYNGSGSDFYSDTQYTATISVTLTAS